MRRFDQHIRIPVTILRIPLQIYWPTLLNKLEKQQFDAGSAFSILQVWKYTADREGTDMQSITCPDRRYGFKIQLREATEHIQRWSVG